MTGFSFDETEIAKAYMDLPLSAPGSQDREEARTMPGNCVKSVACASSGMSKRFGRIVSYGDEVVVVSHRGSRDEQFIWRGNQPDYCRVWNID